MSDDEKITREKKPLSEAKLAAIEKMKEGRKRSLEAKRKVKEEEKQKKKDMKKAIKMRVEEEMNAPTSLPLGDEDFMEDLTQKAIHIDEEPVIINEDELDCNKVGAPEPAASDLVSDYNEPEPEPKPKPKRKPRKQKVAPSREEPSDEEDEPEFKEMFNMNRDPNFRRPSRTIIHNYYGAGHMPQQQHAPASLYNAPASLPTPAVEAEPEEEYEEEEQYYDETPQYSPSAMGGIRFV
mgnify:CR=1 FL=1